jgi:Tol biopolymer transport system component
MIANKDGSEPRELGRVSGVPLAFRFSPDGRRIRFYVIHPPAADSSSIREMDANGKDIHPLFPEWKESPYQCCGNWSPEGDYYYFQAGRGNTQAIWVMPERRSIFRTAAASPSRLTSGPLRFSVPVASSDGKRLFIIGEERRVELFRYDLQAQRFDPYLRGLSAGPVDFSLDRKWMAYVSYPDMTLWRSRVDGSDKMQLTFPPGRAYLPRWSPDGSKIAFMDVQFSHPWKIRLLSSSGVTRSSLWRTAAAGRKQIRPGHWTGNPSFSENTTQRFIAWISKRRKSLRYQIPKDMMENCLRGNRGGAAEMVRVRIKDRAVGAGCKPEGFSSTWRCFRRVDRAES